MTFSPSRPRPRRERFAERLPGDVVEPFFDV